VSSKPKAPRTPPEPLVIEPHDIVEYTGTLWRIHRTTGEHVLPWNVLRTYGPLPTMRYEPHPGPPPAVTDDGVLYATTDVETGLAEVYQTTRVIDTRTSAPTLTAWEPRRALRLLDLSGTWLLRNQASSALLAAPGSTCQAGSRAIYRTWTDLDGLHVPSTMTGRINVVLWTAAADSFPDAPSFTRPLSHPLVWSIVKAAAMEIRYHMQ
jgi:hypothetical protein